LRWVITRKVVQATPDEAANAPPGRHAQTPQDPFGDFNVRLLEIGHPERRSSHQTNRQNPTRHAIIRLDSFFQSDNVLNAVEMELIWLGEESMYRLVCPNSQFDFIYQYASPALKVELQVSPEIPEREWRQIVPYGRSAGISTLTLQERIFE
jgi:hypothetical protein